MKKHRTIVMPTAEEDAAINAGIAADPNTYELSKEEFKQLKPLRSRGRPLGSSPQEQITVHLDKDVIHAFKAGGEGWQNRMNSALKEWLRAHKGSAL